MMIDKLLLVGLLLVKDFQGIKTCTSCFPDFPAALGRKNGGNMDTAVTILIPDMNFTCNATIAGFTFAGINRQMGQQDPVIQIWRESYSQPQNGSTVYYKTGLAIPVNNSEETCDDGSPKIASQTYWCILKKDFRVSVQPGDILGLELPHIDYDDFDIFFAEEGPMNYIFQRLLNSTTELSTNHQTFKAQLPQITFNLTSDQCTRGFPDTVSPDGSGRGDANKFITRLFPDMRFGCNGTIVRMVVAVVDRGGREVPKIQIWRESKTQAGIYHRQDSDIRVVNDGSMCIRHRLGGGIFRCTLSESFQVSVQHGDILGLELPPKSDDDFDIYFNTGGSVPQNYVFEGQLNSTVNISEAAHQSYDLPQINLVVVLENANGQTESCASPSSETIPTTSNPLAQFTSQDSNRNSSTEPLSNGSSPVGAILLGSIIGCTVVAAALAFLIAAAVYKHHKKKHHSHNRLFNKNHTTDGAKGILESYEPSRDFELTTASLPYVTDPTRPHNYEKIPESTKLQSLRTEQIVQKLTKLDSNCLLKAAQPYIDVEDHAYVIPAIEHFDSKENENMHCHTKDSKEDEIYWEPANSVNELYKQLCSNKYREIVREEVEIGMKLGSGQFGIVSKGVWESPKGALDVAVKQLQPGASEEEKVKFLQEAAINGQFRHPNLVMLMGVVTVGEPVIIVLELLSNGDLRTFLVKCRPRKKQPASMEVDEQLLLKFCQQIASGMSYLASKSFVHRDLAARNILVSQDKICKISDFGMSRNLVDEKYISHGGIVPLKWMSPEAINYNKYSTASDVWSFGCVMYEIWSLGHRPFADLTNDEVLSAIEKGYRLPPPPGTSKELYKIMIQCWQPEGTRRPTFPQLVELLSRADFELFAWEEEDLRNSDPLQVKTIGAPLEIAKNLYPDLQRSYITNN